ncbi:MAG: FAD-binding and (Fe-S)-binding domain-containing protein, partial [Actinomycetota bacterium]
ARIWAIRRDGAGLSSRSPAGKPAHSGWEDAAVPPARLGGYLRDFERLLADHGLTGVPYGHFGDGCLHIRVDVALGAPDGRARLRTFLEQAADLVALYGGSLSGEHGDGRTRSGLLGRMYSDAAMALMARAKRCFDPDGVLNPGVVVNASPPDTDVRLLSAPPVREDLGFAYPSDWGDFSEAAHRCIGVAACRADTTAEGGVMCPSYVATRDEKDSTRGRARVLQEMINGGLVTGGWRAPEVHESLDLCLACKACVSECPAGVDMATYKAEVLHQTYRGRVRPRSHYALGRLPHWLRLAGRFPRLANAVAAIPPAARLISRLAGMDPRRPVPKLAPRPYSRLAPRRLPSSPAPDAPTAVLWVDTFTERFAPRAAVAATEVLEDAGYRVQVPDRPGCCALTWISTGQLDKARRILTRTVAGLERAVDGGALIVGLEPSCTAVLRHDARALLGAEHRGAATVAGATRTLAEALDARRPGWEPPRLDGVEVVAQPHCHHRSIMGWETDAALLEAAGADVRALGGCCGMAGNFGVERGHYEVSVAVAELALLPALRDAGRQAGRDGSRAAVVLADGFSCRTQAEQLGGRSSLHLAELLAGRGTVLGDV